MMGGVNSSTHSVSPIMAAATTTTKFELGLFCFVEGHSGSRAAIAERTSTPNCVPKYTKPGSRSWQIPRQICEGNGERARANGEVSGRFFTSRKVCGFHIQTSTARLELPSAAFKRSATRKQQGIGSYAYLRQP